MAACELAVGDLVQEQPERHQGAAVFGREELTFEPGRFDFDRNVQRYVLFLGDTLDRAAGDLRACIENEGIPRKVGECDLRLVIADQGRRSDQIKIFAVERKRSDALFCDGGS